jgi:hypothetical protein
MMNKYTVYVYAIVQYEVIAESPEEANEIAMNDGSSIDLVESSEPNERIIDMSWSWSESMGSEVCNEEGETVLCDW